MSMNNYSLANITAYTVCMCVGRGRVYGGSAVLPNDIVNLAITAVANYDSVIQSKN